MSNPTVELEARRSLLRFLASSPLAAGIGSMLPLSRLAAQEGVLVEKEV